jgi:hypothetical protein
MHMEIAQISIFPILKVSSDVDQVSLRCSHPLLNMEDDFSVFVS